MAWLRRGEGMVAWGVAARCRTVGPRPLRRRGGLVAAGRHGSAVVRDEVRDARHRTDLLRQLRLRRRPRRQRPGGAARRGRHPARRSWITVDRAGRARSPMPDLDAAADAARTAQRHLRRRRDERRRVGVRRRRRRRGASAPATWRRSCSRATWSRPPTPTIDVRWPLRRARRDATTMCWTFHVDRLFGATPELLVRRETRPGHLPRAGRHDPSHRRRRARRRPGRPAGPVVEGPRGARVRRPLGRRLAGAVLLLDERARGRRSCCTCPT